MDQIAFSAATAVTTTEADGRFLADVHPEWTIGGKPNGGYLLAILARAASTITPQHPHVIATSAHYLHSPEPGPVTVDIDVLRAGRSASQVRAGMAQLNVACIEALLTMSRLDPGIEPYWSGGLPARGTTAREDAVRVPPVMPSGAPVAIMNQVDLRLDPQTVGFATGRPRGVGELRGWLTLPGEAFDPTALLYAVDALPPATLDVAASGWVPTLELTAYLRALPAPGPVEVVQKAHLIDAQRVDESCWVWDSSGRLVAQATQLAGIRLG